MIPGITKIDAQGGQFLVRPSLADLAKCKQIGGRWDRRLHAWSFPATRENAAILSTSFKVTRTTPDFDAILAGSGEAADGNSGEVTAAAAPEVLLPEPQAPAPAPPQEPEFMVPAGIRTRQPWRHQVAAIKFCLQLFAKGRHGILLAIGMGGGKTLVTLILLWLLNARRVIILCPLRVIQVWSDEIAKHVSADVIVVALDESAGSVAEKVELAKQKMKLAETLGVPFICVINYDSAWRDPIAQWFEGQRWDVAVADECVPAGTLISTPHGAALIEELREGDHVLGVDVGGNIISTEVAAAFRRFTSEPLVQVETVRATPNHPIWVKGKGYIDAVNVKPGDWIRCYENRHDYLRVVRSAFYEGAERGDLESPVLRQSMLGTMEDVAPGLRGHARREAGSSSSGRGDETELGESGVCGTPSDLPEIGAESVSRPCDPGEKRGGAARSGVLDAKWRERHGPDGAPTSSVGGIGVADGVHRAHPDAARFGIPDALQARHCQPGSDDRSGSGRSESSREGSSFAGREEGRVSGEPRLDGGARDQRKCAGELRGSGAGHLVFNLETSTGNYFANGILVHNCHRAKSVSGRASMFLKRFRRSAAYRLGLTGTPMPHGPMDIFAQFRFLDISIFGPSFTAFRAKYAVMGGYQRKEIVGYQFLAELEALMGEITFRVGSEVLDLPPATHVTYYCDLCPEARRIYRDLEKDFVADVKGGLVVANNALTRLNTLRRIANGVAKTDNGIEHRVDDSKTRLLIDVLVDIGKDEPVAVFSYYHLDLDAVHEACQKVGFTSLELSGRRDELKQWQDGGAQVLAVQLQAGGVGVNLTRARYCLYYSLSFSLGDYDQSQKRVHRPGQTRPVEYIHLVARNTVDVKIMRALAKRAQIVESILAEIRHESD